MNRSDNSDFILLKKYADRCNASLSSLAVEGLDNESDLSDLKDPILYVMKDGGKRIRPALTFAAAETIGLKDNDERQRALDYVACAIELLHSYSLIHDDLPAMDDDDLRRGKPTLHKVYNDAIAILVGDGLQARAFELIATAENISADQCLAISRFVSKAVGLRGMVGGQFIDIEATGQPLTVQKLKSMHNLKTGALLTASVMAGGLTASATKEELTLLENFGGHIGLAFQVTDDILDVEGTSKTLGKTPGKDAKENKPTYVNLLGMHNAKRVASESFEEALLALTSFGRSADALRKLAKLIVHRKK